MIPLPTAVTTQTASTTGSSTAASSSADSSVLTGDVTSTGEVASVSGEQPAFLTLLGNRLLSLAQQSSSEKTATLKSRTEAASGEQSEAKSRLSDLLSSLDKPDALTALLQPQVTSTPLQSSSDEKLKPAITLSDSDLQALQALQAMLPASTLVPRVTKTAESAQPEGVSSGTEPVLNTLTSTGTNTRNTGASVVTASRDAGNQAADAAESASGPAFQQVMSSVSKDTDKENSSSAPNATITTNAISAASAPLTPATTSPVTAPATPQLNSQLGSQEWQQALGQQILMFSRNGQQTAELRLHPQDLGSIQISLKLDSDQAQLSMVSGHSQVRAALEAALPQLRSALAESGINLGQSNVSSDAFPQSQSFNGQQEQQRNNSGSQFSLATENSSDVTPLAVPAALQARAAGSSAVDIFA